MDDTSTSCPGPPIPGSPSMSPANKTGNDEQSHHKIRYSMPGILHFLQTEWTRFEMERSQWEVERAELQARIAFLQGERKGQENLKQDLVRRIKMLEFALKQERAKYNRAKIGMETGNTENKPADKNDEEEQMDAECAVTSTTSDVSNVTWRQGRQLLRQYVVFERDCPQIRRQCLEKLRPKSCSRYLQEIGYTDTILDVRSARVRALLGLQPYNGECNENRILNGDDNGAETATQKRNGKKPPQSLASGALMESEASVLATFDFLGTGHVVDDEDEENLSDGENEDGMAADDESDERLERQQNQVIANDDSINVEDMEDEDTDEALAEFDFLVSETLEGDRDISGSVEWGVDHELISKLKEQYRKERKGKRGVQRPKRSTLQAMLANLGNDDDLVSLNMSRTSNMNANQIISRRENDDEDGKAGIIGHPNDEDVLEVALGLGDLAGLTVNNEADPLNYDISSPKETFRKTWNAKYTLRSHFDGVRALAFHPVEPVLITAAEDHTLKLWNLQKTVPAKKTASLDVEPVYTFRGHIGPVLCLAMSATGEQCFSGGMDSTIRCWNIPSSNIDPYDSYDSSVLAETYQSHTNAVWGLSIHSSRTHLLSCSADGTVKLWSPGTKSPLLNTFTVDDEPGVPSSVDFVRCEPNQMVAAYTSSNTYILDMESSKEILRLETKHNSESNVSNQINRVVSHPTLPVTITAHEDRFIRFFDNNTGKMIHSMVAHLDAVTSLAVDPNGLYLLSGSHDCSIRLWNLESKTCVQEITSHRKKFDESIYDVCFHASKPYIASAGADALAKVFV